MAAYIHTILYLAFSLAWICVVHTLDEKSSDGELHELQHSVEKLRNKIDLLTVLLIENRDYMHGRTGNEELISGRRSFVPDTGLTSSSLYNDLAGTRCSRIGVLTPEGCVGAWHASVSDATPWIQADLGSIYEVHEIATKGRADYGQWVITYRIATMHGSHLIFYADKHNGEDLRGNYDSNTVARNTFSPLLRARVFRLYPITWHDIGAIRWELYGKRPAASQD